jgi:hypothetical protein
MHKVYVILAILLYIVYLISTVPEHFANEQIDKEAKDKSDKEAKDKSDKEAKDKSDKEAKAEESSSTDQSRIEKRKAREAMYQKKRQDSESWTKMEETSPGYIYNTVNENNIDKHYLLIKGARNINLLLRNYDQEQQEFAIILKDGYEATLGVKLLVDNKVVDDINNKVITGPTVDPIVFNKSTDTVKYLSISIKKL